MAKQSKKPEKALPLTPPTDVAGKKQALAAAMDSVKKRYGDSSLMTLGDKPIAKVETISTGCLSLNYALGIGGLPRGRVVEIYGPEAGGKTTLLLQAIGEAQKAGGSAAFIDAEHALDMTLAKNTGVNTETLVFSQPDYGEQGLEILEELVRSSAFSIIGVDSVAALTPLSEIEGDMGSSTMGVQARLMSQALRKLTSVIAKSQTTVVFINQLRHKIGVMFGSPETTTGGNALKFYSSIRIDIRRIESLRESKDSEVYGNKVRAKVVKNKLAPPFREAYFDIIFGHGVDKYKDLVDFGVKMEAIQKNGSWYSFGEEKLGQGTDAVIEAIRKNSKLEEKIRKEIQKIS